MYRATLSSKDAAEPAFQCSEITEICQLTLAKGPRKRIFSLPSHSSDSQGAFVLSCDKSTSAKRWLNSVSGERRQTLNWQQSNPNDGSRKKSNAARPFETVRDIYVVRWGYLHRGVKKELQPKTVTGWALLCHNIPAEAVNPSDNARLALTKTLFVAALTVAAGRPISCDWHWHIQHIHDSKGSLWGREKGDKPTEHSALKGQSGLSDIFTEAAVGAGMKHHGSQFQVREMCTERNCCRSATVVTGLIPIPKGPGEGGVIHLFVCFL